MLRGRELVDTRDRTGPVDVAAPNPNRYMEILFAGIQAVGGAALAVYTNKNSASRIWPIVYTVIAIAGICNAFRSILKIFRRSTCCRRNACSARNAVTGTIIYISCVYAFSEAWKCNDQLWIPFLGVAAFGYFSAVSAINDESGDVDWVYPQGTRRLSSSKLLSKFCQLAFEPVLIACGTIYLSYFRNDEEECLYWLPLIIIGATGLKFVVRSFNRPVNTNESNVLLRKAIEMFMGGFLLNTINVVLAELFREFHPSWCAFLYGRSFFVCIVIVYSIKCLQTYADMDEELQNCFNGKKIMPVIFLFSCLMIKCTNYNILVIFLILAGWSFILFWALLRKLYTLVPLPVFDRYCHLAFGPFLAVGSSLTSAYLGYHKGWLFSWPMMIFTVIGIYKTHKGFRRIPRNDARDCPTGTRTISLTGGN